jgi:hypothetical protein
MIQQNILVKKCLTKFTLYKMLLIIMAIIFFFLHNSIAILAL